VTMPMPMRGGVIPILALMATIGALAAIVSACGGDEDDPRVGQIGGVSELATLAYASVGPQGLYDYLASEVIQRCPREELEQALADQVEPTGWRQIKDVEFDGEDRATATVILITRDGDQDVEWSFVDEGGSWRIVDMPGLERCGGP
jgi:hypothetical protein